VCDPNCDPNTDPNCDPNCDPNEGTAVFINPPDRTVFAGGSRVELQRPVGGGAYVVVDSVTVPGWFTEAGSEGTLSFQRDITRHSCIKRLWDTAGVKKSELSLGGVNDYNRPGELPIQAHPADAPLTNIGEIGMVFSLPAYHQPGDNPMGVIGYPGDPNTEDPNTEDAVRIDLSDPNFQGLLNYLTVFDPSNDGINNDGDSVWVVDPCDPEPDPERKRRIWISLVDESLPSESPEWKIAGRININTAPWFVIAQLPWMTPGVAEAVVAYRDKLSWRGGVVNYSAGRARGMWGPTVPNPPPVREEPGFASIAELVNVTNDLAEMGAPMGELYDMRRYGRDKTGLGDAIDQIGFPDLTTDSGTKVDGAANDFEERDLIFARLSNLVTVRSDVFTAYILVRIGVDGPQKRVIAVFDRSDVHRDPVSGTIPGRVRIRAVHPVPDAR
jgi:hypothetical protein